MSLNEEGTEHNQNLTVEVIPGVQDIFSPTGLSLDAANIWSSISMTTAIELGRLEPAPHYAEYFQNQDAKYAKAGKKGLFEGVMTHSKPEAIRAFDQLVDEFNTALPQIKQTGNSKAVEGFTQRAYQLRYQLPDESLQSPI